MTLPPMTLPPHDSAPMTLFPYYSVPLLLCSPITLFPYYSVPHSPFSTSPLPPVIPCSAFIFPLLEPHIVVP